MSQQQGVNWEGFSSVSAPPAYSDEKKALHYGSDYHNNNNNNHYPQQQTIVDVALVSKQNQVKSQESNPNQQAVESIKTKILVAKLHVILEELGATGVWRCIIWCLLLLSFALLWYCIGVSPKCSGVLYAGINVGLGLTFFHLAQVYRGHQSTDIVKQVDPEGKDFYKPKVDKVFALQNMLNLVGFFGILACSIYGVSSLAQDGAKLVVAIALLSWLVLKMFAIVSYTERNRMIAEEMRERITTGKMTSYDIVEKGWKISIEELHGSAASKWLVAGMTLADFICSIIVGVKTADAPGTWILCLALVFGASGLISQSAQMIRTRAEAKHICTQLIDDKEIGEYKNDQKLNDMRSPHYLEELNGMNFRQLTGLALAFLLLLASFGAIIWQYDYTGSWYNTMTALNLIVDGLFLSFWQRNRFVADKYK